MNKNTWEIYGYEVHLGKKHIFVNPMRFTVMNAYDNAQNGFRSMRDIHADHKVHLFIAWLTSEDIFPLAQFIGSCARRTARKITIHIPRSIDNVTKQYLTDAISHVDHQYATRFKVYMDRDHIVHRFQSYSVNCMLEVQPIHNHNYDVIDRYSDGRCEHHSGVRIYGNIPAPTQDALDLKHAEKIDLPTLKPLLDTMDIYESIEE